MLALAAAGCGGGGDAALDAELAERLAAESRSLAARAHLGSARCADIRHGAARLQAAVVGAINAGDVPAALQEELQSEANELVESTRSCPADTAARFGAFSRWVLERSAS